MAGTQIVAVRCALMDAMRDLAEFADASVSLGWAMGDKSREKVYTRDARFNHQPASMKSGRTFREENGSFEVAIVIEGIGKSQQETSERAVELGTTIEEYVADHRSDFAPSVKWILIQGEGGPIEAFNERGSLTELVYTVTYNARLE